MEEVLKHLQSYWDAAPGSVYAHQHVLQAEIELRRIMEKAKLVEQGSDEEPDLVPIVKHILLDGLPSLEAKVIERLLDLRNPQTTDQLAEYFARSPKTMRKTLASLRDRGLIKSERTGSNNSVQRHWV